MDSTLDPGNGKGEVNHILVSEKPLRTVNDKDRGEGEQLGGDNNNKKDKFSAFSNSHIRHFLTHLREGDPREQEIALMILLQFLRTIRQTPETHSSSQSRGICKQDIKRVVSFWKSGKKISPQPPFFQWMLAILGSP